MTEPSSSRLRSWAPALWLLGLTLLFYLPALFNGYIWDDDNYVLNNLTLRTWDGLRQMWLEPRSIPQYYPLVHSTFWIEYQLWELRPFGYHLVNVLFHAGAAIALWRVLRHLQVPGAWIGAALFALHPVQVESVAWITERKNVLSGLFYFLGLLAYLRFDEDGEPHRWRWYGGCLLFYVAALLSKTVTCSLPAALVLIIWWRRQLGWPDWRRLLPLLPFFIVGVPMALMTVMLEKHHVGAMGEEWDFTLVERGLIAGRVLWFYLGKLIWPEPLMFIYPRWEIDQGIWWLYLFPLAFGALLVVLWWQRQKLGRGPLVAVLIFAGTLVPALGFFNVYPMRYSFVADHFQYLATYPILALIAAAAVLGARRVQRPGLMTGVGAGIMLLLGLLTVRHSLAFQDSEALWRDVISKNSNAWIAHNNLGLIYQAKGQHEQAITRFKTALVLDEDHEYAHLNLALSYEAMGRVEEARRHYQRGLERNQWNPEAINVVGGFFARQRQWEQARICYERALQLRPDNVPIMRNLAQVLVEGGQHREALPHVERGLDLARRTGQPAEAASLERIQADILQALE